MAIRTRCLTGFCELAIMSIMVTILANLRRALEQHFFLANRHFVTITALNGTVGSEQREFSFRMIEASHVGP